MSEHLSADSNDFKTINCCNVNSVDAICELSLFLVLLFAPRGFSPGTPVFSSPQKPTLPNSNSTRNPVDEEPLWDVVPPNHHHYYYYYHLLFTARKGKFKLA